MTPSIPRLGEPLDRRDYFNLVQGPLGIQMDVAFVSASFGLIGAVVGGLTSLVSLYALIANIRLSSSHGVVCAAERALTVIIDTYLAPNRTLREIGVLARDGRMNFLHGFSEVCRADLAGMRHVAR